MPALLTHERFKEELRLFARGALRAELRELGDRVRKEVSQELRAFSAFQAEQQSMSPVSILRTFPDGGTCVKIHEGSRSRQPTGDLVVGCPSSRTPTAELQAVLGRTLTPTGGRHRRPGEDKPGARWDASSEEEDGGIMKTLRSYKVAESNVSKPGPSRRKSLADIDTSKSPQKPKAPISPAHMLPAWGQLNLTGRSKSGDCSVSSGSAKQRGGKLEAPTPGQQLLRSKTGDSCGAGGDEGRQESAGFRHHRRSMSEEVPKGMVRDIVLTALPDLSDSESAPPSSIDQSRNDHSMMRVFPASPTGSKDPGSPTAPAPLLGIVPAAKFSWGEHEPCSEFQSEAQSALSDAMAPGERHMASSGKMEEVPEVPDNNSTSFMSSNMDPFGGQMKQLYFQRDQRRKISTTSEAYSSNPYRDSTRSTTTVGRTRIYNFLEAVVENSHFNNFMAVVIFANLITVGLQTDYLAQHLQEATPFGYSIAEVVFCIIFLFELLARLYVYRRAFFVVPGWQWNVFDCFMVVLQLAEQALEFLIMAGSLGEGGSSFSFGFLRALRILRVIRLLRAARIVEHVRELQTIVLSIGSSLKSLCWTLLLLMLLIFTVGVCFTQLVLNHRLANPALPPDHIFNTHYGSLGASILTLYGSIMGGVDWISAADPLIRAIHPIMGVVFSFYVAFAVLAMMNVVTGVFVEASLKTARDHHEAILLSSAKNLFTDSDVDESGQVTWKEFQDRLDHPHMHEFFKSIDVDISEADTVFHLLDFGENGRIDVDQFMGGCLRLRGPAKAVDLAMLMHETRRMARRHAKQMAGIYHKIEKVTSVLHASEALERQGTESSPQTPHACQQKSHTDSDDIKGLHQVPSLSS